MGLEQEWVILMFMCKNLEERGRLFGIRRDRRTVLLMLHGQKKSSPWGLPMLVIQ